MGAAELVKKLKEHHKVNINYKRVYDGKELALKRLVLGNYVDLYYKRVFLGFLASMH